MKKGISLIVLIITIILMVILAGTVIYTSTDVIGGTDQYKLQIDIAQLENLMNTYKIRKNGNINFETVNFSTAALNSSELQQFDGEKIQKGIITLYVIDLHEIDAKQVSFGNLKLGNKDRYLYSLDTGKVYYEMGLVVNNVTYYYVQNGEG